MTSKNGTIVPASLIVLLPFDDPVRHGLCPSHHMAVRDFRDLACWQLAYALKSEILELTATMPASRDFKFCDQIRDASASAPRNIAEGFGRFAARDFARFLGYARASIVETQNHLIDARDRGYIDEAQFSRLFNLAAAARQTTTRLIMSKQSPKSSSGAS